MQLNFEEENHPLMNQVVTEPHVDTSMRVHASDKRMINAQTDVNQLVPFKYKWAWDMYLTACEHHWMPAEHDMELDKSQWYSPLITDADRFKVGMALHDLNQDVAQGKGNIGLGIYRHLTAPEARQYLLRQCFEEVLAPHVVYHFTSNIDIDVSTLGSPIQADVNHFLAPYIDTFTNPVFKTGTVEADQQFLKALVVYTCFMKGIFSIIQPTRVIALGEENKLPSTVKMFRMMMRDHVMQTNFGVEVINAIKTENPQLWTPELKAELTTLFKKAVGLGALYMNKVAPQEEEHMRLYMQAVAIAAHPRSAWICRSKIPRIPSRGWGNSWGCVRMTKRLIRMWRPAKSTAHWSGTNMTCEPITKKDVKSFLSILIVFFLIAGFMWYNIPETKAAPPMAQSLSSVPAIKQFSYRGSDDRYVLVTSWFEDGVKCTSITTGDYDTTKKNVPLSISCVKL